MWSVAPEPAAGIVVVAVGPDGVCPTRENGGMVECEAEAGDWLSVLGTYRSMKRLGGCS